MIQVNAKQVDDEDPLWVATLGGPHIVVPESACRYLNGSPKNYPDDEGDYGRVCEVRGYIGLIDVGPDKALVLGDHPSDSTFLPGPNLFVSWIAADSTADILETVANAVGSFPWKEELTWDIREPVILFDSARSHQHITTEEHLRVDLLPGRYTVRAAHVQTEAVEAVIVQLVQQPRSPIST